MFKKHPGHDMFLQVVGICDAYLWETSWKERDSKKSGGEEFSTFSPYLLLKCFIRSMYL